MKFIQGWIYTKMVSMVISGKWRITGNLNFLITFKISIMSMDHFHNQEKKSLT